MEAIILVQEKSTFWNFKKNLFKRSKTISGKEYLSTLGHRKMKEKKCTKMQNLLQQNWGTKWTFDDESLPGPHSSKSN